MVLNVFYYLRLTHVALSMDNGESTVAVILGSTMRLTFDPYCRMTAIALEMPANHVTVNVVVRKLVSKLLGLCRNLKKLRHA